jgi:hypothetical protein
MKTISEDYRNAGLGLLEQAGRAYFFENQPFATSHEAPAALIETLAGNLSRDTAQLPLRSAFYLRLLIDWA